MNHPYLPADATLGEPAIDAMHSLAFENLEQTRRLSGPAFGAAFSAVVQGMEMDFRHEEQLMESFQCPDLHLHREQHARMLAALHHAASALLQGDEGLARRALAALADWLPFHIVTQDRHLLYALRAQGLLPAPDGAVPVRAAPARPAA